MYQLICSSYNKTEHGLILRANWSEVVLDDRHMLELIKKWQLPNDFKYPSKMTISDILQGKMDVDDVIIHVRIIKF